MAGRAIDPPVRFTNMETAMTDVPPPDETGLGPFDLRVTRLEVLQTKTQAAVILRIWWLDQHGNTRQDPTDVVLSLPAAAALYRDLRQLGRKFLFGQ